MITWIPQTECIARCLYRIHARNFRLGVWNGENGFIGLRVKWEEQYLFTEYHWDTGEPLGTVKPWMKLSEKVPEEIELDEDSAELFQWLERMREKYDGVRDQSQKLGVGS